LILPKWRRADIEGKTLSKQRPTFARSRHYFFPGMSTRRH
jgi:hypothetical protein